MDNTSENTKKRQNWGEAETIHFINILKEKKILQILDGKRFKAQEIFKALEKEMKQSGYQRDAASLKVKFKNLKADYYKVQRQNSISGSDRKTCPFFEMLHELLGDRPAASMEGIDSSSQEQEQEPYLNVDESDLPMQVELEEYIVGEDGSLESTDIFPQAFEEGVPSNSRAQPENDCISVKSNITPKSSRRSTTTPSKTTLTLNDIKGSIENSLKSISQTQEKDNDLLEKILDSQATLMSNITKVFLDGLSKIVGRKRSSRSQSKEAKRRKVSSSSSSSSDSEL